MTGALVGIKANGLLPVASFGDTGAVPSPLPPKGVGALDAMDGNAALPAA